MLQRNPTASAFPLKGKPVEAEYNAQWRQIQRDQNEQVIHAYREGMNSPRVHNCNPREQAIPEHGSRKCCNLRQLKYLVSNDNLRLKSMKAKFFYCLIICLTSVSCSNDTTSRYGIVTVQLQNGQKIYFKREVWGINGDQLVISASPDLCSMPKPQASNSETDYVYDLDGPPEIYYKSNGNELTLYSTVVANPPTKTPFPVRIVQNEITTIEIIRLRDKASALGLKEMNVEIDRSSCR